jgi:SSS family solute:Na+ symporter
LNLSSQDWLILLLYFVLAVVVGYVLRSSVKTGKDYFQAGRRLPEWLCALGFLAASLGAPEVLGLGAAGAKYGLQAGLLCSIGAIPAMIFVGLFMMPLYYGSKARTVAEFLGLRFDRKTRVLNACLFAAMTVLVSAISMAAMARVIRALHLFDGTFHALGWPRESTFAVVVVLTAAMVLAYVLLCGLAGAVVNQAVQFSILVAGLLPMVLMGLRKIGGWSGLQASLATASLPGWAGTAHAGGMNVGAIGLGLGLSLILGVSYWCADFRVLQAGMAAKDIDSARRVPLLAAIPRTFLPFLLILPGVIAVGLPTPRTTTMTRIENGAIIHTITVVRPEAEAGDGLVPARGDPATGKPMRTASGEPVLDYQMATPNMLRHFLPTGVLGLGLAALLACLMSGLAANLTAFSAVFTRDLYRVFGCTDVSEEKVLAMGRWAAAGCALLSVGLAFAVARLSGILEALLLVFSVIGVPLFATVFLGMFWKRATGHGAFAGLLSGASAALLHHGLTLPGGAEPGMRGGWIAVLGHYPSGMAQSFWTAMPAFGVSAIVIVVVSYCTEPRAEKELAGLVYSLTPKPKRAKLWWQRPEALAAGVLLLAVAVSLFFV